MAANTKRGGFKLENPAPTKGSRGWFYAAIIISALAAAGLLYVLAWNANNNIELDSSLIQLTEVERLQNKPLGDVPTSAEQWVPVALPNDWLIEGYTRPEEWYHAELKFRVPPDRLWEVMLSAINLNAAVYLNGRLLGVNGRLNEPITHYWNQPLRFAIPNGLLEPGSNDLMIRVVSFPPGHGLLGRVYLGPRETVVSHADDLHFMNVEVSRFITGLSFGLCIVAFGLWLIRRQDSEYFWFSLLTLLWGIHSLKFHVTDVPISSQFWAWFLYATSISLSYPLYFFLTRIRGARNPVLELVLAALCLLCLLAVTIMLALDDLRMYRVAEIAYVISFCVSIYGFAGLTMYCARTRNIEAFWITVTVSALVVFVVHDVLKILGLFERSGGQQIVYAMPLLLGSFGLVILRRFAIALKEREDIVANLEQRVTAATDTIVALERDKALADQRETIMRDMHDGVGGQLVSSLALLNSSESPPLKQTEVLQQVLQGALTDLRLMIDSLDADVADLNLLLGALRERMEPVLRAAGFELIWDNNEIPRMAHMTPHKALQVLRILQEALTNAVRHSNASVIRVAVENSEETGSVIVSVEDNGIGFLPDEITPGRGISNMRRRALDVGAQIDIGAATFSSQGTRISVSLQINAK